MRNIGGFFEFELSQGAFQPHPGSLALSTGRACLGVMADQLRPGLVYVPFHSCDATYEPFRMRGISTRFYSLNEDLEPAEFPRLGDSEYFLWTNYYGICGHITERLKSIYGRQLLIDDTHSFFSGSHGPWWSFTSARKYFGVADGAYLFAPEPIRLEAPRASGLYPLHNMMRSEGRMADAYDAFLKHEAALTGEILRISMISEILLSHVDMESVAKQRITNFNYIHGLLGPYNSLQVNFDHVNPPFCYPFLPKTPLRRQALYEQGFFIPRLWADTLKRDQTGFEFERRLAEELLPLPVDHRYTPRDLQPLVMHLQNVIDQPD